MQNIDLRKIYNFQPINPTPGSTSLLTGGDVYYECLDCSGIISSLPYIKIACSCGNLKGAGGSVEVKNTSLVRAVRGALK